jgi:hypothetical protein
MLQALKTKPVRRRLRLFVLLSGALVLASLVPLLVSDAALIRRNRRTLEVLEEKYLTRSSSALADRIAAYHASAREELGNAANSVRLARELTGENPFTSKKGPEILRAVLRGETPLLALRGVNRKGIGSFAGPPSLPAAIEVEFRRAFESARDGASYSGDPFVAPPLGAVSILAAPVSDEEGLIGVVEALVSWEPIRRDFADEARRDVRATLVDREGRILFPLDARGKERRHPSSLVADFKRFPARVTRSETQVGTTVLASIAPVGEPAWAVLVERDRDAAFASVDRMVRDTVLWSAAALLGALGLDRFGFFRSFELLPNIEHVALAGADVQDFLKLFEVEPGLVTEHFALVSCDHVQADDDLDEHLSHRARAELAQMKDMLCRGNKHRTAFFQNRSVASRHISKPLLLGAFLAAAHRNVDQFDSLGAAESGQFTHRCR